MGKQEMITWVGLANRSELGQMAKGMGRKTNDTQHGEMIMKTQRKMKQKNAPSHGSYSPVSVPVPVLYVGEPVGQRRMTSKARHWPMSEGWRSVKPTTPRTRGWMC